MALGALNTSMASQPHPWDFDFPVTLPGRHLPPVLGEEPKGLSPKGLTFPEMHMAVQEKGGCFKPLLPTTSAD